MTFLLLSAPFWPLMLIAAAESLLADQGRPSFAGLISEIHKKAPRGIRRVLPSRWPY
jgi:hypothetical protein